LQKKKRERGRYGNNLVKNCHYKLIFYNRGEMLELRTISSHITDVPRFFKANFKFLDKNYPNEPSHYLLVDNHPRSNLKVFFFVEPIFSPKTMEKKFNQ